MDLLSPEELALHKQQAYFALSRRVAPVAHSHCCLKIRDSKQSTRKGIITCLLRTNYVSSSGNDNSFVFQANSGAS